VSVRALRTVQRRDRGSATVEFVAIGVLLMVPLVYFVVAVSRIQAASFAADSSAREAARAFVTAADEADGRQRAELAVRLGLLDQGFTDPHDADLALECETPNACLTPGSQVRVRVEVRVVLPAVPDFVARTFSTAVTVRAGHVAVVDEFRSADTDS
jgi:TadE-like protein